MSINPEYYKTPEYNLFNRIIRSFYNFYRYTLLSDEKYVKKRFLKAHGFELDLENPKTLNEKINWLKLNDRRPLHTELADKFRVREYIKKNIGEEYLVPLLFSTNKVEDIRPENLPDAPFIIKANHDSSGGIVIIDKLSANWNEIRQELKRRLALNYYDRSKEWQYKNIEKKIIIEDLLIDEGGKAPKDYKFHIINHKTETISVDASRGSIEHKRNWYNSEWQRSPFYWPSYKNGKSYAIPADYEIKRPYNLNKMIKLSEILSKEFPYVRVDWYEVDNKLYFGEITFHHDSGYSPIIEKEWDIKLGEKLKL
ncbi:ATP-grasp fold amidoligase family protein [Cellulophaga sp. HaHa_2_1]|uniref:ATP-grasp fold amidoligase family protein n=1 Tax=Cellulophaga sp. HaHa_2_1 TaxID=2749994 RepID=UPI001C4FF901|nr:ATP-grasp fold amidoligase family protein [Cellulophaga sp. HaHa_2_1]QXP52442.1 glycosyl transferase [Cellulophaga sp. HaHa_2_1]